MWQLGTYEASRFDSNRQLRFNSKVTGTCCRTTNHAHCSTKNFNRCTAVIEIYFMFMIFMFM